MGFPKRPPPPAHAHDAHGHLLCKCSMITSLGKGEHTQITLRPCASSGRISPKKKGICLARCPIIMDMLGIDQEQAPDYEGVYLHPKCRGYIYQLVRSKIGDLLAERALTAAARLLALQAELPSPVAAVAAGPASPQPPQDLALPQLWPSATVRLKALRKVSQLVTKWEVSLIRISSTLHLHTVTNTLGWKGFLSHLPQRRVALLHCWCLADDDRWRCWRVWHVRQHQVRWGGRCTSDAGPQARREDCGPGRRTGLVSHGLLHLKVLVFTAFIADTTACCAQDAGVLVCPVRGGRVRGL